MRENEKPLKTEPLNFLPLKWRELLQRLAIKDKREEIGELLWLIEEYAAGRLTHVDGPTTPRVSLDGRGPRAQFPDEIVIRPMPSQEMPIDPSSHRE
jgi:hypothetical protein